MEDKEIKAPALATIIHTDRTNITRYRNGERTPNFKTFMGMLKFFDCSADYLLGLIDIPPDKNNYPDPPPLGERLRFVISYCKSTQYKLENDKNYSGSEIFYWLSGKKLPSLASLVKLSEDLECSVDFLLGRID
ncbi:MAG: helix-turn-helix domain-containing protein [Prevotella sp.]|nr:helix-turn-helix domain-containing protein [Prevotella sp.]